MRDNFHHLQTGDCSGVIHKLISLEYEQVISLLKMFWSAIGESYPSLMKITPINGTLTRYAMQFKCKLWLCLKKWDFFQAFCLKSAFQSFQGSYLGFQRNGL